MQETVFNGLMGGLGGIAKAIFGAIKNAREQGYNFTFKWKLISVTVVEGAVAGIAAGYVIPSPISAFLAGLGINEVADLNDLLFPKDTRK